MILPDGLLLAYYGDDFTGPTDVMESLSFSGVKTVLFLEPPSAEQIAQFEGGARHRCGRPHAIDGAG